MSINEFGSAIHFYSSAAEYRALDGNVKKLPNNSDEVREFDLTLLPS